MSVILTHDDGGSRMSVVGQVSTQDEDTDSFSELLTPCYAFAEFPVSNSLEYFFLVVGCSREGNHRGVGFT